MGVATTMPSATYDVKNSPSRNTRKRTVCPVTTRSTTTSLRPVKVAAPVLGPAGLISAAVNTAGRLTATPAPVSEDGYYGARTHDAFMWLVDGDRLAAFTRDNVRDVQTWVGRERTGIFTRGDILAIQAKVSARQDGDWIRSTSYVSNTTLGLQRVINKRISERTESK